MNHKQKLRMARRMAPKVRVNVFSTPQWESRKRGIATRVRKVEKIAHERSIERKRKLKGKI